MSSFGGQKAKLASSNQLGSSRPEQAKNQFSFTNNQSIKNKASKEEANNLKKPVLPTKANAKKNEKKVSVAYKTASFTLSHLQKAE